jgi:PepSY-associated TM region
MNRWPMYRIHKWFAVTVGGFFLMWLMSGIIMVLPPISPGPGPVLRATNVDFRKIDLSPAQAVEKLEKVLGSSIEVNQVNLRRIQDVAAYEVHLKEGGTHLLNAASGQVFTITPDMAERYVLDTYPTEGRVLTVESVEEYSYAYQWGSLPAYRVVLDADPSVDFYVTPNDGTVRRSDPWNRLFGALASLHTFEPLKLVTRRDEIRRGLMMIAGIIGIAAAVTGYYLALRRNQVPN